MGGGGDGAAGGAHVEAEKGVDKTHKRRGRVTVA